MRRIDTPLLNKIKEQNQTLYNSNDPRMSIQVSRAKTTVMDSTYWTVETIRTKEGLGDLSIVARRLVPYGRPDRLYNIYIDNGIVKTATREYPDYEEEKWQDQFSLGSGTACAIDFDGYWQFYRKRWRKVTSEKPTLFWVDNNGNLLMQLWDEADTRFQIATGVTKVKAIRGWRNINIHAVDQGLVVGYIKTDKKAYYRNYACQEDGTTIWENERELFSQATENLNVFITNDYRMGFVIEDSTGKIHLKITERAWAGMALGREKFDVVPDVALNFIPIGYRNRYTLEKFATIPKLELDFLYAGEYNEFTHIENIDNGEGDFGRKVRAITKYRLFNLAAEDFKMTDCHDKDYTCVNVEEKAGKQYEWIYEFEFTNFNNTNCETTLICNGLHALNEAGFNFAEFSERFLPEGLVPVLVPPPSVDEITNLEDEEIIIDFDGEIFNAGEQNTNAFTITSKYFKDTFEDEVLEESHNVLSVEKISNTEIKLYLDPFTRIRRANEMTIEYDASVGIIEGETTAVESFTEVFTPSIYKLLDPAKRERFTVCCPIINLDFIKVTYNSRYGSVNLIATADCTIDFIPVEDINP